MMIGPSFLVLIFLNFFFCCAFGANDSSLGKITAVNGRKHFLDGARVRVGGEIKVGSLLNAAKGSHDIQFTFKHLNMFLVWGKLSIDKDLKKKDKNVHALKMTLQEGILCVSSSPSISLYNIRLKSGPCELYMQKNEKADEWRFCLERTADSSYLYWVKGDAQWQKIKPKKSRHVVDQNTWKQWDDNQKLPIDHQGATTKRARLDEYLANMIAISK